jgi:hypothetical protein
MKVDKLKGIQQNLKYQDRHISPIGEIKFHFMKAVIYLI